MMELHLVSRCLICLLTAFLSCFSRENKQAAAACCPRLFLVSNRYFNASIPVLSSVVGSSHHVGVLVLQLVQLFALLPQKQDSAVEGEKRQIYECVM